MHKQTYYQRSYACIVVSCNFGSGPMNVLSSHATLVISYNSCHLMQLLSSHATLVIAYRWKLGRPRMI